MEMSIKCGVLGEVIHPTLGYNSPIKRCLEAQPPSSLLCTHQAEDPEPSIAWLHSQNSVEGAKNKLTENILHPSVGNSEMCPAINKGQNRREGSVGSW